MLLINLKQFVYKTLMCSIDLSYAHMHTGIMTKLVYKVLNFMCDT